MAGTSQADMGDKGYVDRCSSLSKVSETWRLARCLSSGGGSCVARMENTQAL